MVEDNLKIAIIGSRGIPNQYGGFENFTEKLSVALVETGYNVFVSCENLSNDGLKSYQGVSLFYFPLKLSRLEKLRNIYELFYDVYALFWASMNTDFVYMLGYSAGGFFFIPKLFGKKLFVNPDGLEWKRTKFNWLIRFLLRINERLMIFWADEIIADSMAIKNYLDSKYNIKSNFIPYGVSDHHSGEWDQKKIPQMLKRHISYNSYWLVVSRLEPENNIHVILEAYLKSKTKRPLVIVGDYSSFNYEKLINNILDNKPKDKIIIFTEGIYDSGVLNMLRKNCFAYLHGHSVGGTNPSLLESMIMKNVIVAHDNEFNREVCGDSVFYFKHENDLLDIIENIDLYIPNFQKYKNGVFDRAKKFYSWDKIYLEYKNLFWR